MIHPTEKDIGREVIYRAHGQEPEAGIITSFNDNYVFVQYRGQTSMATRHEDLGWAVATDEATTAVIGATQ